MNFPERNRTSFPGYESKAGDSYGFFIWRADSILGIRSLKALAVDGTETGWEHVSVSLVGDRRCPTWNEMCFIKQQFWGDDACVVQFHPAKMDYVNLHPGYLHLWRWANGDFPMPPKVCV